MRSYWWKALIIATFLTGCWLTPSTENTSHDASSTFSADYDVIEIPLSGPIANSMAEISGLAWYQDVLVFLPQYPDRFSGGNQGVLFKLEKSILETYLTGDAQGPLTPETLNINTGEIEHQLAGYEGFEAIAFKGNHVYMTIETTGGFGGDYTAYLIRGSVEPGMKSIRLDDETLVQIPSQTSLRNSTDEALIIHGDSVISIHEANGKGINPNPVANQYNLDLKYTREIPFPNVDYRITDASEIDEEGFFWGINYFFPGDTHLIPPGQIKRQAGAVERLLKFDVTQDKIVIADDPPIQLILSEDSPRNWEGLVQYEGRGFLLITDRHPRTIFGFVHYP